MEQSNFVLINPIVGNEVPWEFFRDDSYTVVYTMGDLMSEGVYTSCGPTLHGGINSGIGTGSYSFDIMSELSKVALMGKFNKTGPQFKASDTFQSGTVGGGRILGYENLGRIAVGHKADILLINQNSLYMEPMAYPVNNIIYHGQNCHIDTVIINGNVIKQNGTYINIDSKTIVPKASQAIEKIWAKARL